jgi:hypothetical protein
LAPVTQPPLPLPELLDIGGLLLPCVATIGITIAGIAARIPSVMAVPLPMW